MRPISRNPKFPRAFTLVELLVVIAIIGILAGLITAAAMRARTTAKEAVVTIEISQLDAALKAYKEKYGDYPPDFSDISTPAGRDEILRHLRRAFPRYTPGKPSGSAHNTWAGFVADISDHYDAYSIADFDITDLNPATALVFWLGGLPDENNPPRLLSFSANARNPFMTGGSRLQPLFEFDQTRLNNNAGAITYSPNTTSGSSTPYVYFRAKNRGYYSPGTGTVKSCPVTDSSGTATVYPYAKARLDASGSWMTNDFDWMNDSSFQILSAGMDGSFGEKYLVPVDVLIGTSISDAPGDQPMVLSTNDAEYDNLTNFATGRLEDIE